MTNSRMLRLVVLHGDIGEGCPLFSGGVILAFVSWPVWDFTANTDASWEFVSFEIVEVPKAKVYVFTLL